MFQTDKVEMTCEDVLIRLHHEQDLLGHALVTRVGGEFCDLGLVSDDQRTVMAHSWVMARSSPLLSSLLREVPRCQCREVVRLRVVGVSGDTLSSIVSLIYSGEVTLSKNKVQDIFEAANLLGIQNILQPKHESKAEETFDDTADYKELEQLLNMTDYDSDDSSNEEDQDKDDGKTDDQIERLMNLVTNEKVSNNDELDQLVTELFKEEEEQDPVEKEKKKYTITGELKGTGGGKGQNFSTVCPKCDQKFGSRHSMMHHHRTKHTKEGRRVKYEAENRHRLCLECGKEFKTLSTYNYHIHYHHKPKEKKFKCDLCDYASITGALLRTHKLRNHLEKSFICDQCSKAFAFERQLNSHIKVVHLGIMIHCPECDFKTATKQSLKKHHDMIHLKMKFQCNICPKEYSTQYNLNTHTKRDHGVERKVYKKLQLENGKTCMYKP